MRMIVDRIEEGFVVCELEDGTFKNFLSVVLPPDIREGSVLVYSDGEYSVDIEAEAERREKLFALQNSIFDE